MAIDAANKKPNIVIILADDMGYSDIGCFGSEVATPVLDRLADDGVRLTQMYNYARCCPSRATLLTGLHPHQSGVGHMVRDLGLPGYEGRLNDQCVTIAEVLGQAGYRTYLSGKWHVGGPFMPKKSADGEPLPPTGLLPRERGFDEFYGTPIGSGSFYNPARLMRNEEFITPEEDDYYYTDAISENASAMIRDAVEKDAPFFLYVAYTAPHWPLHAPDEEIAKYAGRYDAGWDVLRKERLERAQAVGVVDPGWDPSPRDPKVKAWDDLPAQRRRWEAKRIEVYAAQIDRMDQGIGRIMDTLRQCGVEDDTLVMFMSDNGGCAENIGQVGKFLRIKTRDGRPIHSGNDPSIDPGPENTYMSYGRAWANASNTPFVLYKHWTHEGGISTPFVARWPKVTAQNKVVHAPVHFVDLMATCLDVAGVPYPETYEGRSILPTEGESFLPLLRGETWTRNEPLFWEHEGNRAVRQGKWKLVCQEASPWELYDIDADRTEQHNLADDYPDKVQELATLFNEWAERCGVRSWEDEVKALVLERGYGQFLPDAPQQQEA